MGNKKILFFSQTLGSGGSERQMVTIAGLLKHCGYDVRFFCLSASFNFHLDTLVSQNIPVFFAMTKQYCSWKKPIRTILSKVNTKRELHNYLIKHRFDVVVSFLKPCNHLVANIRKKEKGFKLITGVRSYNPSLFSKSKDYIRSQQYADAIVCNSLSAMEMWLRNCPHYREKLFTIYNIVSLSSISSNYIPRQDGKLHVMVAASYLYYKNLIGIIEALKLMTMEEQERMVIDWYGSFKTADSSFHKCKDEIIEHGLNEIIRLHDAVSDINNKQNMADVVALISQTEGLPNAICEAMTIGKPIIMSRVSDYEVLVDDSNGVLVDWSDASSIKEALLKLSEWTESILVQKGQASKEKAMRLFSANTIIPQWEKLF